jgi:3'-5' exoribonuclease
MGQEELLADLFKLVVKNLKGETLGAFIKYFFAREDIAGGFFSAPGARSDERGHHAFKGGLAYHTLTVALLATRISDHYNALGMDNDVDLVIAGVMLHDIGKIDSYEVVDDDESGGVKYSHTKLGKLHHHIPIGFHKVLMAIEDFNAEQKYVRQPELSQEVADQLGHIILSHHGRKSWSSPVTPQNIEAYIVHSVEMMDSYVYKYNRGDDVRSIYDN